MKDLLFQQQRDTSLRAHCEYCDQPIGEICVNPTTRAPLMHQPAHFVRITAGATAAATEAS